MSAKTEAMATLESLPTFALASMAEARCDNDEAGTFYRYVRDNFIEAVRDLDGDDIEISDDQIMEIANGAPDAYNHTRMMEAIGTGAYLDTSDLATGEEDMLTLAGYVLDDLARALLAALKDRLAEEIEEIKGNDEHEVLPDEERCRVYLMPGMRCDLERGHEGRHVKWEV